MKFKITIECGKKTCATRPGKFCRFVQTTSFGMKPFCFLYNVPLDDANGWLMRCRKCLNENKEE